MWNWYSLDNFKSIIISNMRNASTITRSEKMHIEKIEDNLFKLSINDKLYILNREDLEKLLHRLKGEN